MRQESTSKREEQKGGISIDLSDTKVQLLGTALLILLIVGIAVCAFVAIANKAFSKQSALLEAQESELVYLRRLSQSEKQMDANGSPGRASEGTLIDPQKRKKDVNDLEKGKGKYGKFNNEDDE